MVYKNAGWISLHSVMRIAGIERKVQSVLIKRFSEKN